MLCHACHLKGRRTKTARAYDVGGMLYFLCRKHPDPAADSVVWVPVFHGPIPRMPWFLEAPGHRLYDPDRNPMFTRFHSPEAARAFVRKRGGFVA